MRFELAVNNSGRFSCHQYIRCIFHMWTNAQYWIFIKAGLMFLYDFPKLRKELRFFPPFIHVKRSSNSNYFFSEKIYIQYSSS